MNRYSLPVILTSLIIATPAARALEDTDSIDTLQEFVVTGNRAGVIKSEGLFDRITITRKELYKAACCNLGESFTTNPSVDVSYNDAATGAKQIKLLGLSGSYVQMLTENIPNFRGLAMPYALGYVPGPWMQSIQVSKGAASVKNGYESVTGQINIEYLKPQSDPNFNANAFIDSESRYEFNADANYRFSEPLSGGILAHYEDTYRTHDGNSDGFIDKPSVRQLNLVNRWAWMGEKYIFQGGVKLIDENRRSGQTTHTAHSAETAGDLFEIGIKTRRYEAFAKNAFIIDGSRGTNIALMLSASYHSLDGTYGHKLYDADQRNLYASLMFETNFSAMHSLSTGLSYNGDGITQWYRLTHDKSLTPARQRLGESVAGAYAQYTFNLDERLVAMAGLRADHSTRFGTFVTPRAHLKWSPSRAFTMRASAGRGYRTVYPLTEFNYLISSGRTLVVDNLEQEAAWNMGASMAFNFRVFGKKIDLNAEYYYTTFDRQAVVDYDTDATVIHITNLRGKSYSHTMQVDATCQVVDGLSVTAAYRLNDVKSTYGGILLEKPLTGRSKGLLTASYTTPLELWQFDATLQINGGGRLPLKDTPRYGTYAQLNAQITRWFKHFSIYIGGENLTGYRQKNPIINASTPWSADFEPTLVWGPLHGAMAYLGFRYNLR